MNWSAEDGSFLTLTCVTGFDFDLVTQAEWDDTALQLKAPIYMSFDWLRVWCEHYAARGEVRLFLLRRGGVLVSMLPVYIDTIGSRLLGFKVAKFVGANLPPKTFDPPIAAEYSLEMLRHVLTWLFARESCDLVSLGPVSKPWPAQESLARLVSNQRNATFSGNFTTCDVQTLFRLPSTFEEYLTSFGTDSRKSRMKRIRQLERDHKVQEDVVSDPNLIPQEFEAFAGLHERQWRKFGRGGHFNSWPRSLEYNRKLAITQASHGRTNFFRLLADGHVVANRYTFRFGDTVFSELPAREVGEPWDKLGIGVSSLIKFTGQAIACGVRLVDSGLGQYDHKSGSGGEEIPVGMWRITPRAAVDRAKGALAIQLSRGMILACRKLWYRRIATRLPNGHASSQASWWLRFDY
jgi:hypothetical protein